MLQHITEFNNECVIVKDENEIFNKTTIIRFGLLFMGISTFVGYLMSKSSL